MADSIILCHQNDLVEQSSKGFRLGDNTLFAVKRDGTIFLYRNQCPHLGVELNWNEDQFLDMDKQMIQCSTHGALFLIESGECVAGPCLGKHLTTVPFEIIDGQISIEHGSL